MRPQVPRFVRKLPYYLASLVGLARIARVRSIARCIVSRDKRLDLRDGHTLRLSTVLDLLVVKETLVDDAYGLRELDASDGLVVDVGAGVGEFALAAAARHPGLTVCAYEPNSGTFELLERNLADHAYPNVEASLLAIGTRDSYVLRRASAGPRASAAADEPGDQGIEVRARRLDEVLPPRVIRLLKVDCEGLEVDVLQSASGAMDRVEKVVVEYHRHLLPEADRLVAELLRSHGLETSVRADPYDDRIGYVLASRGGATFVTRSEEARAADTVPP